MSYKFHKVKQHSLIEKEQEITTFENIAQMIKRTFLAI